MTIDITFPGGLAVEARGADFSLRTDQPAAAGGEGSAPSPFDAFLASLGTCAGFFALKFCRERDLDTRGLKLSLQTEKGTGGRKLDRIVLTIELPSGFPEKYRQAIVKATDLCSVKRVILDPPEFETILI